MRHKVETIAFAQGWLGNQLERAQEEQITEEAKVIGTQILDQWRIIDEALDDLLKERQTLLSMLENVRRQVTG